MGLLNELDDLARIVTKGFDEGKTVESAAANASKTESSAARSLGRELPPATLPGTPMPSVESLILKGAQNHPDVSKLTPARFDPNSVEIPDVLDTLSRNPTTAQTDSKDLGKVHEKVLEDKGIGGEAWTADGWLGSIKLNSTAGPNAMKVEEPTVLEVQKKSDGKYYADVGIYKDLRGTGEGSAAYESLGKWAKNNGITISASADLTPQNTIKRSGNVAAAIMKEKDSSIFDVSPLQFIYTTDTFVKDIANSADGKNVANAVGEAAFKNHVEFDPDASAAVKASEIDPVGAKIHDEAKESYDKYWNPKANPKDETVISQRANNLIANQVSGIVSTIFEDNHRWTVRHFGNSLREQRFAGDLMKFLGTQDKAKTVEEIRKGMVEVGSGQAKTPFIAKMIDFLKEYPEYKNTVIPAAALGVGIETQSDDEVSKQNVQ